MAIQRDDPYAGFAFLVSLGGDTSGPVAGFLRVTGLERRVEVLQYRAGNDRHSRRGWCPVWPHP